MKNLTFSNVIWVTYALETTDASNAPAAWMIN